jgi:hypothetical protein
VASVPMVTRRSFPFVRKAVMSLPAADKSVWEIKIRGGGVPLRSAGCGGFWLLYTEANNALPSWWPRPDPGRAWVSHTSPGWIQVTPSCFSLQVAFWGIGGKAAHHWGLFWGCAGQVCWSPGQPGLQGVSSGCWLCPVENKGSAPCWDHNVHTVALC